MEYINYGKKCVFILIVVVVLALLYVVPSTNIKDFKMDPVLFSVPSSKLKSKVKLEVSSSINKSRKLNKTRKGTFVLYNRIAKCGSTTMNSLLAKHRKANKYDFIHIGNLNRFPPGRYIQETLSDAKINSLKNWIDHRLSKGGTTVLSKHLFYINMEIFGKHVIYINQLRDPVDR